MKAVCKKLFSLMLVAIMLVSAVPFQVSAAETEEIVTEVVSDAADEAVAVVAENAAEDVPVLFSANELPAGEIEVYYQLEDRTQVCGIIKANMSNRVSYVPSYQDALNVYAQKNNGNLGMEFVRWYYKDKNGNKHTFDGWTYITEEMYFENGKELNVYAQIQPRATTIYLNPNGGSISPNSHQVKIDKTYNEMGNLPSPTREHYDFAYWVNELTKQPINGNSVVENFSNLVAHWTLKQYTVQYKNYTNDWANAFGVKVEAKDTVSVADGTFPDANTIKSVFALDNWNITGWEYSADNGASWKEFKEGSTQIVSDIIVRPIYKKTITLYACDSGNTTRSLEVTLGKNIPILPHPGTREGLAFVGWYFDAETKNLASTKDDLSNVSKHPVVTKDLGALYAGWHYAKTVYLYIHTNGNTKEHTKLVRYYDVPETGFDLTDIDLYEIFPNYGKYDDKGDEKWGWYDAAQWENFCMNKHKYQTTEYVNSTYLANDDVHEFYIMLNDNGNNTNTSNNGYNDNKNTVDSSNPSTGDDIFVAVTIMAVSACAVLLIFMNKKRFVK